MGISIYTHTHTPRAHAHIHKDPAQVYTGTLAEVVSLWVLRTSGHDLIPTPTLPKGASLTQDLGSGEAEVCEILVRQEAATVQEMK